MQNLLQNQTAIVTGGTAGIGKEIAIKFAEQGARVAIFGTNSERGQKVVADVKEKTGKDLASFYRVNVSSTEEVARGIKEVQETYGNVDILINNAGITRDQLLIKMSEQDWDDVIAINVK